MSIPKIVHFTVSANPTKEQQKNIEAAKEALPGYEVKVWRDPVKEDGFRLSEYWQKANSGAQLADLIRLEVVYRYGGVYLDSDIEVHRNFDDFLEEGFFIASEDGEKLTNAVFGARKKSNVLNKLIEALLKDEPDWDKPADITTGPEFFARQLKWNDEVTVLPRKTFYAYNWDEDPEGKHPVAIVTHTWKGSWLEGDGKEERGEKRKNIVNRSKSYIKNKVNRLIDSDERGSYKAEGTICAKTKHGHDILLDGKDLSITPKLIRDGYYEKNEEVFTAGVLHGGDHFIDVGANVGIFSLLAARQVGPFGRVFAFEPNPSAAALLRKSAVMNWLHDRIIIQEIGIAEDAYTSNLTFSESSLGGGRIEREEIKSASGKTDAYLGESSTIETQIRSLDNIFHYDVPIKLLKIDVEGLEDEVIRGANRLIENRCIDYIMIEAVREIAGDKWPDLLNTIRTLAENEYTLHSFADTSGLREVSIDDIKYGLDTNSRNIVLVSEWA